MSDNDKKVPDKKNEPTKRGPLEPGLNVTLIYKTEDNKADDKK